MKVYPDGTPETHRADHWRCRFVADDQTTIAPTRVTGLLSRLVDAGLDVIKTENLDTFDGAPGFSLGQGR